MALKRKATRSFRAWTEATSICHVIEVTSLDQEVFNSFRCVVPPDLFHFLARPHGFGFLSKEIRHRGHWLTSPTFAP